MTAPPDPIPFALDQMRALGLLIEALEIDGLIHRVDVEGERKGKKPGWYICNWLTLDNGNRVIVGTFGIWRGAENNSVKLKFSGSGKVSEAERIRWKEKQEASQQAIDADRVKRAQEAARRSKDIWDKLPQNGQSDYLKRKKIKAHGIRFGRQGSIAVPLRNAADLLVGLQWIQEDGTKRFISGTPKKGAYHFIGMIKPGAPLVFVEGYATGASVHEATEWPVVICFDCGNLTFVAKLLRDSFPGVKFLFAGDDDHQREENAGRQAALEGAKQCGGIAAFPAFEDPNGRTDFNDLHVERGLDEVRAQLKAAYKKAIPAAQGDPEQDPLVGKLNWGDRGLRLTHDNLMLILQHHKEWQGVFGYDQFAKRIVKRRKTPYGGQPGPIRDSDEVEIAAWLSRADTYSLGATTSLIREALLAVAERQPFHPVRDYLNTHKWDGFERIDTFLIDFCSAADNEVNRAFSRNFFLQAVARVFEPGCVARLMLVLEGEQDKGKSTIPRILAGIGFYADVGTPPSDKDFFQIIQGIWIVEISEMASFARAESSHIKRAISVPIDRFRKSYGHNVEEFPRECVFVGTVNNQDWQRDETGGTRFMPVWVGEIDLDGIRGARDQLWAEAVHRYKKGEPWHILPESAREVQEERYLEDPWAETIYRWLEGKADPSRYRTQRAGSPIEKTTVSEVLYRALDLDVKKQDRSAQTRAGNLLRRLGWTMKQKWIGKTKVREYVRPVKQPEPEKGP